MSQRAPLKNLDRDLREAQVLASLNHPNIAAIYGLEDPEGRWDSSSVRGASLTGRSPLLLLWKLAAPTIDQQYDWLTSDPEALALHIDSRLGHHAMTALICEGEWARCIVRPTSKRGELSCLSHTAL